MLFRVLGIDPGSHHLGIGCVEKSGHQIRLVHADILHAPAKAGFYERLEILSARLKPIVDKLSPHEVAIEDIFAAKNPRSAFRLGVARGVAVASCLGRGILIAEYAPSQVKAAVTGYGRADKTQVQKMVRLILGAKLDLGFDATDALAVAICHVNSGALSGWVSTRKGSVEKSGDAPDHFRK
jgi:crossover junction endodeoxyribonuclease RuvC